MVGRGDKEKEGEWEEEFPLERERGGLRETYVWVRGGGAGLGREGASGGSWRKNMGVSLGKDEWAQEREVRKGGRVCVSACVCMLGSYAPTTSSPPGRPPHQRSRPYDHFSF